MRWNKIYALAIAVSLAAGCVSQQEFDEFKAGVIASGTAVDAWILQADSVLQFLDQNWTVICPQCAPPSAPPPPPPDGGWGE